LRLHGKYFRNISWREASYFLFFYPKSWKRLPNEFFEEHKDKINWYSALENIPFNGKFLLKFQKYIPWNHLGKLYKNRKIGSKEIKHVLEHINWANFSKYNKWTSSLVMVCHKYILIHKRFVLMEGVLAYAFVKERGFLNWVNQRYTLIKDVKNPKLYRLIKKSKEGIK